VSKIGSWRLRFRKSYAQLTALTTPSQSRKCVGFTMFLIPLFTIIFLAERVVRNSRRMKNESDCCTSSTTGVDTNDSTARPMRWLIAGTFLHATFRYHFCLPYRSPPTANTAFANRGRFIGIFNGASIPPRDGEGSMTATQPAGLAIKPSTPIDFMVHVFFDSDIIGRKSVGRCRIMRKPIVS